MKYRDRARRESCLFTRDPTWAAEASADKKKKTRNPSYWTIYICICRPRFEKIKISKIDIGRSKPFFFFFSKLSERGSDEYYNLFDKDDIISLLTEDQVNIRLFYCYDISSLQSYRLPVVCVRHTFYHAHRIHFITTVVVVRFLRKS